MIGFKQALELDVGLVIERHGREVAEIEAGLSEDIIDGVQRKAGIVLAAGKALLLGRGHELPVTEQCGGTVVVKSGYAEDAIGHGRWRSLNGEG